MHRFNFTGRMTIGSLLAVFLFASLATAQGVLIDIRVDHPVPLPRPIIRPVPPRRPLPPPPTSSYRIDALDINASLEDQVARVQVSQTFENTGSSQMEVCFVFPLPYDGAIDRLTLLVDGKEFEAKLLTKEEARRRYEEIVRKNRDPALLEWVGNGMFQTSVFPIPAGAKRTVTLRYSQLLRKSYGLSDFIFPLSTARYTSKPLERLKLRLSIETKTPILNVYSATHAVKIDRPDSKHAVVSYEATNIVPGDDFRLFFDNAQESVGASVISHRPKEGDAGYFLLLASPEIKAAEEKPVPKTVIFVVDRSGSMSDEKMNQARDALKFVLNNLRENDLFNIVAYDSEIQSFRPELEKFNDTTRAAAIGFADNLYAGGSTDIDGALRRALGMISDSSRPTYVLFLTDGLPTAGETNESAIVKHTEELNRVRAHVFAFGVGYDVNSRLLDRLARANFGLSQYVRPKENIEASVSALYRKISAPVMTDVALKIDVEGGGDDTINRVYPKGRFDLFAGDQAVIVGRYRTGGTAKVTLRGKLGGEEKSFDFPADLAKKSSDDSNAFVGRLWATRRVGEIIDEIDLKGRNQELINELVSLATDHGILTPYTSFLADETSNFRDLTEMRRNVTRGVSELDAVAGEAGVSQRVAKGALQQADQSGEEGMLMRLRSASGASGQARGGRSGGGGPGAPASSTTPTSGGGRFSGNATYYDAARDEVRAAQNIRQIGSKTFFQRGERLVDSTVTEVEEKAAQKIERYSDAYFALADRYGREITPYLALDDPVVVKIDGTTYEW
ncbi:MAG: VIT domain-containing protein [Pirellulales bacterium]